MNYAKKAKGKRYRREIGKTVRDIEKYFEN